MFGAGSEQKLGHDGEAGFIIYIDYGKYNPKKASQLAIEGFIAYCVVA